MKREKYCRPLRALNLGGSFIIGLAVLLLAGCEAPLVLDSVDQVLQQPLRRSDALQAMTRANNRLVAVGAMGVVLTRSAHSDAWTRRELPGKPFLMDAASCPDGRLLALDYKNRLWLSRDSETWEARPIASEETPQAITCDANGGIWVVGGFSSIVSSNDSGQTWQSQSLDEDTHYTSIQFIDAGTAYITGEFGVVVRTVDGGKNWENLPPLADEFYPHAAYFKDRNTGWVVGLGGTIYHTTDGAATWLKQATGTAFPLHGIAPIGDQIVAVGNNGTILIERDGEWKAVNHNHNKRFYLRAVIAAGDRGLFAAGGSGTLFRLSLDELLTARDS